MARRKTEWDLLLDQAAGEPSGTTEAEREAYRRRRSVAEELVVVAREATYLAEHLERVVDRIRTDVENGTWMDSAVNTLGELQGRGLDVDRHCIRFGLLRELARWNP